MLKDARFLMGPLLALGQPVLPALQVAAELLDLVLDRPDLLLDLAAILGRLLRGLLGLADDGLSVGLGARPQPLGLLGGRRQLLRAWPQSLRRGRESPRLSRGRAQARGLLLAAADRRLGRRPPEHEDERKQSGNEPDRQYEDNSVTHRSPLPAQGLGGTAVRRHARALQRGVPRACEPLSGATGQADRPRRTRAAGAEPPI